MLNTAVLMGRLTANPEIRHTANNVPVTSFTLAIDRSFVKAGADRQTDFVDIVAWSKTAEFVTRYFHKGQLVAVQGRIETRTYKDKNGNSRKAVEIVAENVHFAEPKHDTPTQAPEYEEGSQTPSFSNAYASDFQEIPENDDDLPF